MRRPLTDEELDQIEREINALAAEAQRIYPKRRNETRKRYNHRIDQIIGRWITEGHVADLLRLQGKI